jgi:hypothetical protein
MALRELELIPYVVVLICDKCGAEVDTSGAIASVADGKKVIPTKCAACGDETIQPIRYPYVVHKRK